MLVGISAGLSSAPEHNNRSKGMRTALLLSLAAMLLATGCGDKIDPVHEGDSGACSSGTPVTWANQMQSFFARYCTSCHSSQLGGTARNGAPPTVNWDTYAAAFASGDRADVRAGMGTTMPPSPPMPSQAERDLLHCWVVQGKKER
jgi:uncharacterized membrane protein